MYGGHFGFAMAARAAEPNLSLAVLVPAAFAPDLARLAWTGVAAFSSAPEAAGGSVATTLALAVLVGAAWGWRRKSVGAGTVLGLVVASHAVGDLLEGAMTLWPGGPAVGMELSDIPLANHAVELAIIGIGWYAYRRSLPGLSKASAPRSGPASRAALGILLVVLGFHLGAVMVRTVLAG